MNGDITLYRTLRDGTSLLSPDACISFREDTEGVENRVVNVYDDLTGQTIIGFGAAFTEAAAVTWAKLSEESREAVLKAYFDPKEGHGYTFCRTHMNSCDFSVGNYACDEIPGDIALEHFSLSRELETMIPMMKAAGRHGRFQLFISPWSPPAWMKDSNRMNRGGKLLPECRRVWARYYARFIKALRAEGLEVWGLTVQNEPKAIQSWDSCVYTADEERDFVRDHLGPVLAEEGLEDVKILIWDHNKERLYDRAKVAFEDPEASKYIWGAGFHWYSGDHFEAISAVRRRWPDKGLVFTEGCTCLVQGVKAWDNAEQYGHDLIGSLNAGMQAWAEWNIMLDEIGGPNHVGNYCEAPVIIDTKTGRIEYKPSWYYIGHFSRFIVPGSVQVCTTRFCDEVECTAFRRPDGQHVMVVLNRKDCSCDFTLRHEGRIADVALPAHSIATLLW